MRTMTKRTIWIAGTALVIALPTATAWASTEVPPPGEGRVEMMDRDAGWNGSMMGRSASAGDTLDQDCAEYAGSDEMRSGRSHGGAMMRAHHGRGAPGQEAGRMDGRGHMGPADMWDGATD